jgi:hypothetical protein
LPPLPAYEAPPLPAGSWLAITAEEQKAIELWDRSPEKSRGVAALDDWLDSHADSLPKVDAARLKRKLWRQA